MDVWTLKGEEAGAPGQGLTRVVVIGAEATGKTTLARRLAAHYGTVWLPEYLRAFVEEKGALPAPEDTPLIAQGHLAQEAALIPEARGVLVYDTDLVSTCVYHRYYFGEQPPEEVERLSYARHADLYLLTDTDLPWTPDPGQRDGPAVRAALHDLFRAALQARGLPFVLVSGPPDRRLATAIRAIERLRGGE